MYFVEGLSILPTLSETLSSRWNWGNTNWIS